MEAIQASQAALNPAGVTCTLSTSDGRARFRMGERIRVLAGFSAEKAEQFQLDVFFQSRPSLLQFGTFTVAPSQGVADPLAGVPAPQSISIAGYVPPPVRLTPTPHTIALDLNEWLRFDRPGVYRVFFSAKRVSPIPPGAASPFGIFGPGGLSTTSNILQLEIVPAEPAWQEEQAALALQKLKLPVQYAREPDADEPSKTLRFGNARPFALAMIERLSRDDRPRSWPAESNEYRMGLQSFPDRDWLIAQMIAAQARPGYAVSESFLDILATLQAMREAPAPAQAQAQVLVSGDEPGKASPAEQQWRGRFYAAQTRFEQQNWLRLSAVVEPKAGAVRALSLHSLLDKAWHAELGASAPVQQKVPRLAALLAPLLDLLPALPLNYVLQNDWPRLRHDAKPEVLLASLERLWARPILPSQGRDSDVADLLLRRISELSPARGRALIRAEIESARSRASIAALKTLPEETLPALDAALLARLTTPGAGGNTDVAAQLIERYGSPALAAPAAAWMKANTADYVINTSLLTFLLRTDEAEALGQINAQLDDKARPNRDEDNPYGSYSSLLHDMGAVRWSPALQRIALARLGDARPGVASDAARALSSFGSPECKQALLKYLSEGNGQSQAWRQKMEPVLVQAIAQGESWLASASELKALEAACRTPDGRRRASQYASQRAEPSPGLYFDAGGNGYWNVAGLVGTGEASLRKRLAQFPRGTIFKLQTFGFGAADREAQSGLRAFLQAHGMSVEAPAPRAAFRF